jgi:hypothetical protein
VPPEVRPHQVPKEYMLIKEEEAVLMGLNQPRLLHGRGDEAAEEGVWLEGAAF